MRKSEEKTIITHLVTQTGAQRPLYPCLAMLTMLQLELISLKTNLFPHLHSTVCVQISIMSTSDHSPD